MSDDILDLAKAAKERALQDFAQQQNSALIKAAGRIKELEAQVRNLTEQLEIERMTDKSSKLIISAEEFICDKQLEILRNRAIGGQELTLEEVKKLDLLVKNKRIAVESLKTVKAESKPVVTNSTDELLSIASQVIE